MQSGFARVCKQLGMQDSMKSRASMSELFRMKKMLRHHPLGQHLTWTLALAALKGITNVLMSCTATALLKFIQRQLRSFQWTSQCVIFFFTEAALLQADPCRRSHHGPLRPYGATEETRNERRTPGGRRFEGSEGSEGWWSHTRAGVTGVGWSWSGDRWRPGRVSEFGTWIFSGEEKHDPSFEV